MVETRIGVLVSEEGWTMLGNLVDEYMHPLHLLRVILVRVFFLEIEDIP